MSCEEIRNLLDDHLDRRLTAPRRKAVEEHLESCAGCRRELEGLTELLAEARRLAGAVEPHRDLWPAIETRLSPRRERASRHYFGRLLSFPAPRARWLPLAAAAALALLLLAPPVLRRLDREPAAPVAADAGRLPAAATLARSEDGVLAPRRDLLVALAERRGALAPETAEAVEESARSLDRAIGELRTALEEHPDNLSLRLLLASRYRQEAELAKRIRRL